MNVTWNVERLKGSGKWAVMSRHVQPMDAHVAFEATPPPDTLAMRIVKDSGIGCCSDPYVVRERRIA